MAQVSNSADQDPALANPSNQPEEGKKNSLLNRVKEKAKETVEMLKTKVKKGSDDGSAERSERQSSEESNSEAQRESKVVAQHTDEATKIQNGSGHQFSFGGSTGESEEDRLSPFARASAEKNPLLATPLIATPTSYGDAHTTVEDVMPPAVIEPTSVSELGEESASNLGNIPEAKDEEKAAVKEVEDGGPDSDINEGFKDTFQQKDLQAIDGLRKPRGFDVGNESVVRSGDLGFVKTQGLADQIPSRETEGNAEDATNGGEREFPVDGSKDGTQSRGIEQDNEKPHPPGSIADFKDSMFFSSAIHDLKANEPSTQEAKHAGEIGTFSRDFDPEANKSSGTEGDKPHPPGSMADFKDSMFSSHAIHDLKPNEPKAEEAKKAGEIGTFSRDFDPDEKQPSGTQGDARSVQQAPAAHTDLHENMFSSVISSDLKPSQTSEPTPTNTNTESSAPTGNLSREDESEGNTNFHDAPKELPPPANAGERMEDRRTNSGASAGMGGSSAHQIKSITAEEEAENYFDALSDDEDLASQRSLDSDASKGFNPEATTEYEKQRDALKESADQRIEVAKNDEKASNETGADSNLTEGNPTMTSTLRSVVNSVGSKAGFNSAPPSSSEAQGAAEGNANATSDKVSTWISKAIGVLLTDEQEDEATESDSHR